MPENPNTDGNIQGTGIPKLFMTVTASQNVQTPVDKTLSISEMAADAKATGDAINNLGGVLEDEIVNLAATVSEINTAVAGKADAFVENISVNGHTMNEQGAILINAGDILMSESETTVNEAVTDAGGRIETLETSTESLVSSMEDATERLGALEESVGSIVRSVNNTQPDETGNVDLTRVPYADNLLSTGSQNSREAFLIRTTGGDASISDGTAQISSILGNMEHTGFIPESITYSVSGEFEISIDRNTFVGNVSSSGTITFNYTTEWDQDLSEYGITIDSGEPENGDSITVEYVMEERGTITPSGIQTFVSTGWNLYSTVLGYARVLNYSENYGFRVGGAYSVISFSNTIDGPQILLTVTNGNFQLPSGETDGYIFVTGADSTTEIYMTWGDWNTQANGGTHQVYSQFVIDLSSIMSVSFPYGLLAVGDVHDEINFSNRKAYSRIEVMEYNDTNLTTAENSGRAYIYDEYMIYLVRDGAVETQLLEGLGQYTANDHGLEMITGTTVAPTINIVYSNDLKNKLERDVLTISQQTLTSAQKSRVQENLGMNVANNLTTTNSGYVLDARQGKILNSAISAVSKDLADKLTDARILAYGIPTSGTTFKFTDGTRAILALIGTTTTAHGIYLVSSTTAGVVALTPVMEVTSSGITITTGTSKITISTSVSLRSIWIIGMGDVTV